MLATALGRCGVVHDFCDFEFVVDDRAGDEISAYVLAKNPYAGRAFRSAIEAAYGPVPASMSLAQAFAAVRDAILTAARRKVVAVDGEVDQPVPVIAADICGPESPCKA